MTIQRKRIILLSPSLSKGGAETQLIKIASELQSRGFELLIISLKPINEFDISFRQMGLKVVTLNNWMNQPYLNWKKLKRTFSYYKPDLVIAFMFAAILFARMLKREGGFKLISSIRISVIPAKWHLLMKLSKGMDDEVVFNSDAAKANFERLNLVKKESKVIHNLVAIPRISIITAQKHAVFTWVCVAHFRWNKDYVTLFEAIARHKPASFRVDIIGALNEATWPYQMILDLGIKKHVRLLDFQQDPSLYVRAADAFVLSSHSEGMPNALMEAMSHGKPVVATAIDGITELVAEAKCGLLTRKKNAKDLAEKMKEMMAFSPAERQVLGNKGKLYIEQNFNKEKVISEWVQLINQLS
ncbi:glycosyltransferase [Pedobacter gandavensis]|uniref:glycosyltransferase n=1 Tax=Pedobacter gandavensis TaxID=2679963 RepID=UPI0029319C54|nr:glycosyltransferase [Pedobacter gandavensis]